MNITLTSYESEALFADLKDEWDSVLNDSAADQIFLTWTWLSTWWEAYQPGHIWSLVMRDEQGQCVGIAPWFMATLDGRRIVRPIGCVDVTDYLEVIARRGFEDAVYEALAGWLADHAADFDVIYLCNIPEESPMLNGFTKAIEARPFEVDVRVEDVCPLIQLPDDFRDYVAGLDKKNRHEVRRKLRKAAGSVEWYIVGSEHDLEAEMATFLKLMAASHPEKAEFLEDERNRRFFELMVPPVAEKGWLQLAILEAAGEPAAAYLNFDYANRILVYNSGHDPAVHGSLSPGIVLLARLIEHAISCKREIFDFLRGDEPYKYNMGGKDTDVYRIEITKGG